MITHRSPTRTSQKRQWRRCSAASANAADPAFRAAATPTAMDKRPRELRGRFNGGSCLFLRFARRGRAVRAIRTMRAIGAKQTTRTIHTIRDSDYFFAGTSIQFQDRHRDVVALALSPAARAVDENAGRLARRKAATTPASSASSNSQPQSPSEQSRKLSPPSGSSDSP